MLAVTLSKDARARAVQLPAWNEALGLPRPWDQQWSLRMQQILAYETDLLEYGDIFDGSPVIAAKVAELKKAAKEELEHIEQMGGTVAAVESGYLKQQLVEFEFAPCRGNRARRTDRGRRQPLCRNRSHRRWPTPPTRSDRLGGSGDRPDRTARRLARRARQRSGRRGAGQLCARRRKPAPISCRRRSLARKRASPPANGALRCARAFGEYRAPTGVGTAMRNDAEGLDDIRAEVDRVSKKLGRRLKFLVGKPGLDGHSNGAEQIAARARDAGMDVVYDGIRLTAEAIAAAAAEKNVHVIGLSILSGSHLPLVHDVMARMKEAGIDDVPVVVGGIIPPQDASALKDAGVAEVYTPKDFELNRIMADVCASSKTSRRGD